MRQKPSAFAQFIVILLLLGVLGLMAFVSLSESAPAYTVHSGGNPHNRVDIAIMGDGYRSDQLGTFASHVNTVVGQLFGQQPFKEYKNFFNVHRIDLASPEAGADHPELGSWKNTALDATYYCNGLQRLLCVDTSKVLTVAQESLAPEQRDLIIVVVNDPAYGGAGYSSGIAVAAANTAIGNLVLHEFGHSFGGLADEYGGPPPPDCENWYEPPEINVVKNNAWGKWGYWMGKAAPSGTVGTYEGTRYCDYGLFRPTPASKMRELGRTFEPVNTEALIKRIYNRVDPVDWVWPGGNVAYVKQGQDLVLYVATPTPATYAIGVVWIHSVWILGYGNTLYVNTAGVAPGWYVVEAWLRDNTSMAAPNSLPLGYAYWYVLVY